MEVLHDGGLDMNDVSQEVLVDRPLILPVLCKEMVEFSGSEETENNIEKCKNGLTHHECEGEVQELLSHLDSREWHPHGVKRKAADIVQPKGKNMLP